MIDRRELEKAIDAYQNSPNTNIDTCVKLAALYTIYNELYGEVKPRAVEAVSLIETTGETEFLQAVNEKPVDEVLSVINELMETLCVINRRGYDGVIRKLNNIGAV